MEKIGTNSHMWNAIYYKSDFRDRIETNRNSFSVEGDVT